jgi:hypothetical protein
LGEPVADGDLTGYARDLQQSVLLDAGIEGAEQMRSEVFTRHVIDILVEAGELENALPCHLRERGIEVHGYGIDDEDTLNLLTTIYSGDVPPGSVSRTELDKALQRLINFWDRCREQPYHERLEESSDAYDMALHIHRCAGAVRRVRLFVLTDGRAAAAQLGTEDADGIELRRSVWDIVRLHRLETSGQPQEPIEINFVQRYGEPLACLSVGRGIAAYDAMLTVFPGAWLADIYNEYGPRLLELNVRSFLQAAGKVNRGIRDTLRDEPERFLAYNNGIAATASAVDLVKLPAGGSAIAAMRDLQIVNGGQTTASIHRALVTGIDLSAVSVQAKVTVVDPASLEEIVPLISRFANSQNRVSEADLSANDPFHVEIETLSRTVWTPVSGDTLRQTRWFYERARGQYRDAVNREGTPARRRAWQVTHPPAQRFTKTDLAKFENTWAQLPHDVSRGAQKNFTVFMGAMSRTHSKPGIEEFHRLVAKAILWKRTERIVSDQQFGGYRANLVAYAIAKLSHATGQRVDLARIWEEQALTEATEAALADLSHVAWEVLVEKAPTGTNITEWAKREQCWKGMRDRPWSIPPALSAELVSPGQPSVSPTASTGSAADDVAVAACLEMEPDGWFAIADWAKQTDSLQPWQRKLAFDIGIRMKRGRPPSVKQAQYGRLIVEEAGRLGFSA